MGWAKTHDEQATCIVLKTRQLFVRQRSERSACVRSIDGHHRSSRNGQDRQDDPHPSRLRGSSTQTRLVRRCEMADQIKMLTVRIKKRDATIAAAVCRRIKWQGAKCAMIPMGEISILIRSSSSMRLERDRGIRRSASRISSWQAVIDRVRQAGHMTAPSDGNFRNKCTH